MDAVFLSDIHLKSLEERNGKTLLRFLASLEAQSGKPPMIFLLGDIFDLWVSNHRVFLERYDALLQSLKRLSERGSQIVYFEGNHDMHLAIYWEKYLGADVRTQPGFFQVGGLRIRCEHGDEINRDDTSYLKLRAFLRHPIMEKVAHLLPGRFLDSMGDRWSKHSRKRSSAERIERESRIRKMIRRHAELMWEEDPFDAIISGHMHVKDDWSFEKNQQPVRAINLGSWFETQEVLVLENRQLTWKSLSSQDETQIL